MWLVTAHVCLRNDGSNCPAKYTSWPCWTPSSSSAAATVVVPQQWHHHGISAALSGMLPNHICSIPAAPRKHQNGSHSNCHVQWSCPPHHIPPRSYGARFLRTQTN